MTKTETKLSRKVSFWRAGPGARYGFGKGITSISTWHYFYFFAVRVRK